MTQGTQRCNSQCNKYSNPIRRINRSTCGFRLDTTNDLRPPHCYTRIYLNCPSYQVPQGRWRKVERLWKKSCLSPRRPRSLGASHVFLVVHKWWMGFGVVECMAYLVRILLSYRVPQFGSSTWIVSSIRIRQSILHDQRAMTFFI